MNIIPGTNMKRIMFALVMFCMGALWANGTFAQVQNVEKGDRVRLSVLDTSTFKYNRISGHFFEVRGEYIFITRGDSTFQYPLFTVRELEISTGVKRRTGRGALIGAALGGTLLGIYASVETSKNTSDYNSYTNNESAWEFPSLGDPFLDGFTIGAFLGGGVGAIIGSMVQSDVWEKANWQLAPIAYTNNNKGAALRFQIRF